jgi:hypothetical protein
MSVLLVTYDHKAEGLDYTKFFDVIERYDHVKLSESAYAIDAPAMTPYDAFVLLRPLVDSFTDRLFIAETTILVQYHPIGEVHNWLMHRLPPR